MPILANRSVVFLLVIDERKFTYRHSQSLHAQSTQINLQLRDLTTIADSPSWLTDVVSAINHKLRSSACL